MSYETSPPRHIYYGWFILAASFFILFATMTTRNSFGLFFKPILAEFGLSRAALSLPVSLSLILFGVSQPIGGLLIRRFGSRAVITFGTILTATAVLGMTWISSIWGVYFFYGLILGLGGSGNSATAFTPLVLSWFRERRGLAMSIVVSGFSIGQLVGIPLIVLLLAAVGWRSAFFWLGVILFAIIVPLCSLVIRDRPKEVGLAGGESERARGGARLIRTVPYDLPWVHCLKKAPFLLLASSFFTCGFTVTIMVVHWVPFATDVGFSLAVAASAFAVGGGLNTVGTLIVGPFSDRWGRKAPLSSVYAFRGLWFLLFILFKNEFTVWAVPMMIGLSWSATVPLTSALTGDFFGVRNVGVLFGLIYLSHQLGAGLGAWLSGYIFDLTGSYDLAFALAAYLCFQAAFIVSFIKEKELFAAPPAPGATPA